MEERNNVVKKVIIAILALIIVAVGILFALKSCQKEEPVVHTHSFKINEEGTWICKDDNDILSNTDEPYVAILEDNQPKDIIAIDSLSKTKSNLGNGTIYKDGNRIYYSGNNAQTVIIKTQKVDDNQEEKDVLVINATNDTVYHYGSSTVISLEAVATDSFHESGEADLITLTKGRIVLESNSDVKEIYLDINNINYSYETAIIALKEDVELPRLTRDAINLEEGEVKTLAIVQKLKDEVKTETNAETNEVIETILEVQAGDDNFVKIENVKKIDDELIIEAFLSPNADENDNTKADDQSDSTVTLEEAKDGSSHPASHNTFVSKEEKITETVMPTETKTEETEKEETKPVVKPTVVPKQEEEKPKEKQEEDKPTPTPSHTHSYGDWYDLDDTYHAKKCSCGDVVKEEHDIDANGVCKKCGHYAVAKIGNVYYGTLEAAVAAAQNKSVTIVLLTDIDLTEQEGYEEDAFKDYFLENDVLDLNNHSITANKGAIAYDGDNLVIKNGKFIASNGGSYGLFVGNGDYDSRISTGIVLQDIETVGGISVYYADVTIKNAISNATKYYAVWGDKAAVITIESGTYTAYSSASPDAKCIINAKVYENNPTDSALITIKGGNYDALYNDVELFGKSIDNIKVQGGTFNKDPSDNVVAGYTAIENKPEAGKYTVETLFAGGSGTLDDPFLIETTAQCKYVDGENVYYKLMNDLTITNSDLMTDVALKDPRLKKGDTCSSLFGYISAGGFDGNNHTISLTSDNTTQKPYRNIFSEVINNAVIKNLNINADGYFSGIVRWATNAKFDNVNLYGDINWNYKNLGAFVHYYHYGVEFNNCNNYATISNSASAGSAYCAIYVGTCTSGYYEGENTVDLIFNNCNNYGTLISNQAGMFVANGLYNTSGNYININIKDSKNYGLINNLGGNYNNKSNYITADTWDKAYGFRVSFDGGNTWLTSSSESKWYDKENQQSLIGDGGMFVDSSNENILIRVNGDKTISIDATSVSDVDHIVLHITMNSSKVCDITETFEGDTGTSTIKDYMFVPQKWVDDNSLSKGELNGYDIVTKDLDTYYVTKDEVTISGPTSGTISVMAFDENDNILCSSRYSPN